MNHFLFTLIDSHHFWKVLIIFIIMFNAKIICNSFFSILLYDGRYKFGAFFCTWFATLTCFNCWQMWVVRSPVILVFLVLCQRQLRLDSMDKCLRACVSIKLHFLHFGGLTGEDWWWLWLGALLSPFFSVFLFHVFTSKISLCVLAYDLVLQGDLHFVCPSLSFYFSSSSFIFLSFAIFNLLHFVFVPCPAIQVFGVFLFYLCTFPFFHLPTLIQLVCMELHAPYHYDN